MTPRGLAILVAAVWLPAVRQQHLELAEEAELISSLRDHFHSGCVFLLYPASSAQLDTKTAIHLLHLQHLLGTKGIATASIALSLYDSHLNGVSCRQGRPLNVVLSGLPLSDQQLHQLFSRRLKVSYPRWLLLPPASLTVPAPFDCELLVATQCRDSVCLMELYQVASKLPLQVLLWGEWSFGLAIKGPTKSLYLRRADLQGVELIAAAVHDPPMEILMKTKDGRIKSRSFYTLVWTELEHRINCTTRIVQSKDNAWGSVGDDGRWSGMVGMLQRGEADLSFSSFIMTSSRRAVMDYTLPVDGIRAGLFVRAPGVIELSWQAFVKPFSHGLWLATFGSLLVLGLCLSLLHTIDLEFGSADKVILKYHINHSHKNHLSFGVGDCLFYMWGSFCLQGYEVSPRSWPCRLVLWVALLCAGTLLAAYSGNFTASLAVGQAELPFTTLQGLLEDGSYQLGVVAKGSMYSIFQNAQASQLRQVYQRLLLPQANSLPKGYREGFARVCSQRHYAFMDIVGNAMSIREEIPCALTELPHASFNQHGAMALVRDSPYKGLINYHMLELHKLGVIRRLSLTKESRPSSAPDSPPRSVTMDGAMPVLSIWATGILLSVIILLFESWRHFRTTHISTPTRSDELV